MWSWAWAREKSASAKRQDRIASRAMLIGNNSKILLWRNREANSDATGRPLNRARSVIPETLNCPESSQANAPAFIIVGLVSSHANNTTMLLSRTPTDASHVEQNRLQTPDSVQDSTIILPVPLILGRGFVRWKAWLLVRSRGIGVYMRGPKRQ